MKSYRFNSLIVRENESDLWIGISPEIEPDLIEIPIQKKLKELRSLLSGYIARFSEFGTSFDPVPICAADEKHIILMKDCSAKAGVGPMAAVAGLIAEEIGKFIQETFHPHEVIVENGGDIYLSINSELVMSIDAGTNRHFSSFGLSITPEISPLGICTSSGMFGHSTSLGKADAVTVACKSTPLADAWATSIANRIQQEGDVNIAMELHNSDMISLICIKDEKIGVKGSLKLLTIHP
jgi:ApbE superfamily uncharacterized protein (UPF0280 family)